MTYLLLYYLIKFPNSLIMILACFYYVVILSNLLPDFSVLCYRGDTGITVVAFSAGTVLFVNPKSEGDAFPTVAGSSAVVGVSAYI